MRACSYSWKSKSLVTIGLEMTPEEEAAYEAAGEALRSLCGRDRPEWFWLAVAEGDRA